MKSAEPSSEVRSEESDGLGHHPLESPEVDIYEGGDELLLIADLPGVSMDGVTVSVDGTELTIAGKRATGEKPPGEAVALETSFADFRRSFVLPRAVDPEGIRAEIRLGVLRVHLPKAAAKPRSIPIKGR